MTTKHHKNFNSEDNRRGNIAYWSFWFHQAFHQLVRKKHGKGGEYWDRGFCALCKKPNHLYLCSICKVEVQAVADGLKQKHRDERRKL